MSKNLKVLCLGDNTSTDAIGSELAIDFSIKNNLTFRGSLDTADENTLQYGCYVAGPHTLQQKDIINFSKYFDKVVLLDQKQEQYSHNRIFLAMWKLVKDLKEMDIDVEILNEENMRYLNKWEEIFEKNKSICVNPWILLHDGMDGYTNLCGRNWNKIKKRDEIADWQNDKDYNRIRNGMLNGEKISGCDLCYKFESQGMRDMRWTDSFDWITRLKLKSIDDLKKIKNPPYAEIRPSNKCNIMCRMCRPNWSHLIDKEVKNIDDQKFQKIVQHQDNEVLNNPSFDKLNLDKMERIYIAGGEPTVMPEVYEFLRRCVKENKTNFEMNINTNAVKISDKLFNLFSKFKKLWFTCSIDGPPKVTEYIRWGTNSQRQISNIHRLKKGGAGIHFISVISIYNVHVLGDTMEFFDREFPYATVQLNLGAYKGQILDAFNHPNQKLVLNSLIKARNTKCYFHQERGSKPIVDSLIDHYTNHYSVDRERLSNFFYYNDTLDKHRGSSLSESIPELEDCRKVIK